MKDAIQKIIDLVFCVAVVVFVLALLGAFDECEAGVVVGQPTTNPYANGNNHYTKEKQRVYKENRLRHYKIEKGNCKRGRIVSCTALHNYEDMK
jgi:hypothetical protein